MNKKRNPSLRWRIVRHLTVFQSIVLLAVIALVVAVLVAMDIIQINEDDDTFKALESAVALDANDKLVIRPTPALVQLRQVTPDLWFVVRDQQGRTVREGQVPDAFARLEADLDGFGDASIAAAQKGQRASIRRIKTEAGPVVVLTNALTTLAPGKIAVVILAFFVTIVLPIFTPLAITTVIVTHLIVRRGVAGLQDAAAEAERIDVERRGARLPVAGVPSEIVPLVNAVNNALARLDEGYERHKRFLADAAHEIRTPMRSCRRGWRRSPIRTTSTCCWRMWPAWRCWPSSCLICNASIASGRVSPRSNWWGWGVRWQRNWRRLRSRPATIFPSSRRPLLLR